MASPSQYPYLRTFIPESEESQKPEKKHKPLSQGIQFWDMRPTIPIKPQPRVPIPKIQISAPSETISDDDESPGPLPGRCQLIRRSNPSRSNVLETPSEKMFGSQIDSELDQLMQNRSESSSSGKGKRKSTEEEEQKVQTVSQRVLPRIQETPVYPQGLSDTPFQWPQQNFSPLGNLPSSTSRDSSSFVSSTNSSDAFRPISSSVRMESDSTIQEEASMDISDPFNQT